MTATNIHTDETPCNKDHVLTLHQWKLLFRAELERSRCAPMSSADRNKLGRFVREHAGLIFHPPWECPGDFEEVGWPGCPYWDIPAVGDYDPEVGDDDLDVEGEGE